MTEETTEQAANKEKMEAHISAYSVGHEDEKQGELIESIMGDVSDDYLTKLALNVTRIFTAGLSHQNPVECCFSMWLEGVALGKSIAEAEALEKSFAQTS